jgi:hypothetical protein
MDFLIPAGSSTNLPKEVVDRIVENAVEGSVVMKLLKNRDQLIPIANEGTIPVIGAEDLTKIYRLDGTDDITDLTEQSMSIKTPDLAPIEIGHYLRLKDKQVKQYPGLKLEQFVERRMSRGLSRAIESLVVKGDTDAAGSTNLLNIADGIAVIAADSSLVGTTAIEYATSEADDILDAVSDGVEELGAYGDESNANDLFIFASSDFMGACRKAASKDFIGYTIEPCVELGLQKVVHLHGIPVLKRSDITGEKSVLCNLKGAFVGYFDNIGWEKQREAGRRGNLYVVTYWIDFKWAFLNSSSKAEGIVQIGKASS